MQRKLVQSIQTILLLSAPALLYAQDATTTNTDEEAKSVGKVTVTGSRIPRAQTEGPAPVTVITEKDIKESGMTTVPEILKSITQNGGDTQSQQSASGADFSPGAEQVDLRALGPNRTLVLVNGRRIADFPLPFKGRSNFTDISSIPTGMIERIEILTGSASAIYGSDAISGVINFILKKKADGTTVDLRLANTDLGGGRSLDVGISSGFSRGKLNTVFGLDLRDKSPLWAYEREIQDSTKDSPRANSQMARRSYLRTDSRGRYIDPGAAACAALAGQNQGSTYYAERRSYGRYCGTDTGIGYGTIMSKRKGANAYAAMNYALDNGSELFADMQMGHHNIALFRDVRSWSLMLPDGDESGYFFNRATNRVELWQRQFSPEEMGGLETGMVRTKQDTFALTAGIRGTVRENWDYEASLSHSQYKARISWPQIISSKANMLFLGPQLGTNAAGYPIFNANSTRLYTPLTRAEYDSIFANTVYHPKSRTETATLSLSNDALFQLPGGNAGFASALEIGQQAYDLNPDPRALEYYYYSWKDSDGHGSRNRWALASELRMPVTRMLNVSLAGRFDQYRFADRAMSKPTYSAGIEFRPLRTVLIRGSYGTAFRAPDLHYVFAGPGNDETSGIDYYNCRKDQAEDCSDYDYGLIRSRNGNKDLNAETSKSWTAGFVWSPTSWFNVSADWFDIRMANEVQDMSVDQILRDEASCRLGQLQISSPTCVDALSRITRDMNGELYGIHVNPINVARENTSGVDVSAQFRLPTRAGTFKLGLHHTWVKMHDFQQYAGDLVEDQFAVNGGWNIPRTRSSATLAWDFRRVSASLYASRIGKLPNYWNYAEIWEDGDPGPYQDATYRMNLTLGYRFSPHARISITAKNLANKMPPLDPTWSSYPYYNTSWFDAVGREYVLNFSYKFGGKPL